MSISVAPGVSRLRSVFSEEPELFASILNASSPIEVNLALDILRDTTPERALVAAINLREVLSALPVFPCSMAVDEVTLARVAGLEKDRLAWCKPLETDLGLSVTTAGNFCFDLIVQGSDGAIFLTPVPRGNDIVNPKLVDAIMHHEGLLAAIVDLVIDMGIVFNPRPYLSLEDWSLDHAQEVMDDVSELFWRPR
ncbi:MAG: hypothetical protein Q7J82_00755 [Coriobacteriia bacterium]|nr:hypothetical protein [Coriobacteriia bacterium]